jgi:hypothetical protein
MNKKAGIMGTAVGLLKKPALGALKSVGKYELAQATGGLGPAAVSLAGSATGSKGLTNLGANLTSKPFNAMQKGKALQGQAGQFGQAQDRNMPKMAKLNRTFDKMMELEKEATTTWKDIAIGTAIATAVPIAIGAGYSGSKKVMDHMHAKHTWNQLRKEDPSIDNARDRENFQVLKQFGAGLAHNKTTARSFLDRTRNTYMMPHEFVGDLINTQDKLNRDGVIQASNALGSSALSSGMNYAKMNKKASLSDTINALKEKLNDY